MRANLPAAPTQWQPVASTTGVTYMTGLTIREHFAAQFMAAMISNPVYDALEACVYAERAAMYADQLIVQLGKVSP